MSDEQRKVFESALENAWEYYNHHARLVDQFEDNYTECAFAKGFHAGYFSDKWHDAQGDYLPEIDREVIVIDKRGKVSYAHRPDKRGLYSMSVATGKMEKLEPMTYDKGGWNIPDVRWWLDCSLPNLEEEK